MDLFRGTLAGSLRKASALALYAALVAGCSGQGAIPASPTAGALPSAAGEAAASAVQPANAGTSNDAVVAAVPSLQGAAVRDLGPAARSTVLDLAFTLRYRHESQLDRLIEQQSEPGNKNYRNWLTNEQFDAQFAPTAADYRRVTESLKRAGFHIDATYDNRTVLDASAPVATIDRYFQTSVHRVDQANVGERYVNVRPAYAPAALRDVLLSVDGLDTLQSVHTDYQRVTPRPNARQAAPQAKSRLFGPVSQQTGYLGYGPLAFSAGYDMPVMHTNGGKPYNGMGRASGIMIDADFAESDLRAYLAYFHVTRTGPATKRVLIHGGPPKGDGSPDSVEATLDSEALVGSAPGTALTMYEMPSLTTKNITDSFNTVVSQNAVDSLNTSFGGCEAFIGAKAVTGWNNIIKQGVAKGIVFHASSGDTGGGNCPSAPASIPYVVAVGGTTLTIGNGGAWVSETAWAGSGGGISSIFPRAKWQNVPGAVNRGRNVPDLAFDADPVTGMAVYYAATWNSQYNPLGGTSLASPLFGAMIADIDQVKNGRVGLSTAKIYGLWSAHGYGSGKTAYFHDIVQGGNGAFFAQKGYDLVSGIGSVDGWNLAGLL